MHGDRRRTRGRARILYWFRTPPGVRVGRAALDADVMALIEAQNPGIEFDWPRLLKEEGGPPPESRPRSDGPDRRARPLPSRRPAPVPPPTHPQRVAPAERPKPERPAEPPPRPGVPAVDVQEEAGAASGRDVVDVAPLADDLADNDAADLDLGASAQEGEEPAPDTPAGRRLGGPGLRRLRARYAEVVARIPEKVDEPERRQELIALAERLNPDAWATDEAVVAGLEQYEAVHESLRAVVGRRRRGRSR